MISEAEKVERFAAAEPGVALLRHRVAGIRRSASSDWDLAVRDAGSAGRRLEEIFGSPDLRIDRQYVIQRFYSWGEVDFLPCFEWNGIEFLEQERFWAGVACGPDHLPRPRLAHDAFCAWIAPLLCGGRYKKRYDPLVAQAAREDRVELFAVLSHAFGAAWAEELMRMAENDPADAGCHVPALRRSLIWNVWNRSAGDTLRRQIRHWRTEFLHHVRPPYPWIAFLGPDGSGKSSVISAVRERLAARRLGSDVVHWRPQVLRKSGEVSQGAVIDPHAKPARGPLFSVLALAMLNLEWWLAWPWRLRHPRAKNRLLLSDRYFHDLLVDPKRYRYGGNLRWAERWFGLLPVPDRVIILTGDAATIHARKREVSLPELQRQTEAYRKLGESLGARALVIDAAQPLERVIDAAYEEALRACRFRSHHPAALPAADRSCLAAPGGSLFEAPGAPPPPRAEEAGRQRLRVLISAYACGPDRGAEANVAWNLIRELTPYHDLCVITRKTNREVIEGSGEAWISNVRWEYLDPPPALSFWRQGSRGIQPFYVWWQMIARRRARRLLGVRRFDLIHHVTFGTYLLPSPLSDLGLPLVFGPVGGGERTPPGLARTYRLAGRWEELLRDLARSGIEKFGFVQHWHRAAAWNIAATPATEDALLRLGVTRISALPQSATGGDAVERFASSNALVGNQEPRTVKLVCASRLVHWKAINLALRAVAVARGRGLDVRLTVLQEGPELSYLKRLARQLALEQQVEFAGKLPTLEGVFACMAGSDALLHPALHEAFGQACLESLALGVPVICLDWGGPGMIVTDECGIRVEPADEESTVNRLADAIECLGEEKRRGRRWEEACKARARDFQWNRMAAEIDTIYRRVVGV